MEYFYHHREFFWKTLHYRVTDVESVIYGILIKLKNRCRPSKQKPDLEEQEIINQDEVEILGPKGFRAMWHHEWEAADIPADENLRG